MMRHQLENVVFEGQIWLRFFPTTKTDYAFTNPPLYTENKSWSIFLLGTLISSFLRAALSFLDMYDQRRHLLRRCASILFSSLVMVVEPTSATGHSTKAHFAVQF